MPFHRDPWVQLFGGLAIEVLVVVALALILQRHLRTARWRRTLWQGVILGLTGIVVLELSGAKRLAIPSLPDKTSLTPPAAISVRSSAQAIDLTTFTLGLKDRTATPSSQFHQPPILTPPPQRLLPFLVWVWLTGSGIVGVWMIASRIVFVCFVRQTSLRDDILRRRVEALARPLGCKRRIAITEIRELSAPIAFGLFRPSIGLPEKFRERFSSAQQDAMLAHELAHLAAHDTWWQFCADGLVALLWWHPLVYVARRQWRTASETVADDASRLIENGPVVLAECLVELAKRLTPSRSLGWLGMEGGDFRSRLGQRVERLVRMPHRPWMPENRWIERAVKGFGLVTMLTLVIAATAWLQPSETRADTIKQAFRESMLGLALAAAMPSPQVEASSTFDLSPIEWQPWNPEAAQAARASGSPVLVNFTNKWETMDWNNELVLETPEVRTKLRETATVVFRADLAEMPAQIASEVQRIGREDHSLIWLYPAMPNALGNRLPQPLTPQIVIEALEAASAAERRSQEAARHAAMEANRVPGLIFAGKAHFDAGRRKEAEAAWREALKLDPQNPATKLYLARLQNVATNSSTFTTLDPGRTRIHQKLDQIRLEKVEFHHESLKDVVQSLERIARNQDPERRGLNFIPLDYGAETTVNLTPGLSDVTIRQALDAICVSGSSPLFYQVESYAVVISSKPPAPPLHTRWFKIDPTTPLFVQALNDWLGTNAASSEQNRTAAVVLADLRRLFVHAGLELAPPKSLVFNEAAGQLMIRATHQDFELVDRILGMLNTAPAEVRLEVRSFEASEETLRALGFDWFLGGVRSNAIPRREAATGILTDPQFRVVLRALEQRAGVNLKALPSVTTPSGRHTQIKLANSRSVANALASGTNISSESPVVDLLPVIQNEGPSISLTTKASWSELVGYDQGGSRTVTMPDGRKELAYSSENLPVFQKHERTTDTILFSGQTLVMTEGSDVSSRKPQNHLPPLGDLPIVGHLFRENAKARTLIFVIPTIVNNSLQN